MLEEGVMGWREEGWCLELGEDVLGVIADGDDDDGEEEYGDEDGEDVDEDRDGEVGENDGVGGGEGAVRVMEVRRTERGGRMRMTLMTMVWSRGMVRRKRVLRRRSKRMVGRSGRMMKGRSRVMMMTMAMRHGGGCVCFG